MPVSTFARVTIVLGVLLGIAGDAFLNVAPWGIGVPLWIALAAGGLLFIVRAQKLPLGPRFWLALAGWVVVAATFGWRDAPALRAFNMAALILLTGVLLCEVQPQLAAPLDWVQKTALRFGAMLWRSFDVFETWFRTRAPGSEAAKRRMLAITRGGLLVLPLTVVFGGLLVSADAAFENVVLNAFDWNLDVETGFSHFLGFAGATWIGIGLLSAPGAASLMRLVPSAPPVVAAETAVPAKDGWRLGLSDVGFILATLCVLFGAFVAVQFRYFFGGDAQVQTVAGLTYADYARKGFFELVWVAALATPVLLGSGKVALREGPRGHRFFMAFGSLAVGLLMVIMVSAWQRMGLYVEAYGLTGLRFYVCAAMVWIGAVLALMIGVFARRRPAFFAPGAAVLGVAAVMGLNFMNPDGRIAEFNLDRAARTSNLDIHYLSSLSLDAAPAIAAELPEAREVHQQALAHSLAQMEEYAGKRDWRTWNWSLEKAERAFERSRERVARR